MDLDSALLKQKKRLEDVIQKGQPILQGKDDMDMILLEHWGWLGAATNIVEKLTTSNSPYYNQASSILEHTKLPSGYMGLHVKKMLSVLEEVKKDTEFGVT